MDWRKWTLWILWPLIAAVIIAGVSVFIVLAWFFIPFGKMVKVESGEWSIQFPWSD